MSTNTIVFAVITPPLMILLILALTRGARRAGIGFVSHLKCERCAAEFDYAWIPGVSFTSFVAVGSPTRRIGPSPANRRVRSGDLTLTVYDSALAGIDHERRA